MHLETCVSEAQQSTGSCVIDIGNVPLPPSSNCRLYRLGAMLFHLITLFDPMLLKYALPIRSLLSGLAYKPDKCMRWNPNH